MRVYVSLLCSLFFTSLWPLQGQQSSVKAQVLVNEKMFSELQIQRKCDEAAKLLDDNERGISIGIATKADFLLSCKSDEDIPTRETFSQVEFTLLSPTTALVTYLDDASFLIEGKPIALQAYVASLWVKHRSKWLVALHTATSVPFAVAEQGRIRLLYPDSDGQAQQPAVKDDDSTVRNELLQVETDLLNAYVHRDLSVRDRYVADDFVGVGGDGEVYSKQQDTQDLRDGKFAMKSFKLEDVQVRFLGDSAIVTGRNTATTVYKGNEDTATIRFADTFLKHDGRWQMLYSQDTNLAQSENDLSTQALAKEREIQDAQKRNDWPDFADLLSDDLIAIDEDGIRSKKELLDAIKAADIHFSDYKMEDVKIIAEGNGAIVAYKQTLVGTEHGKSFTWHIYTHSHWERRGGKWLMTIFQDSMAKE